jgi:hypothetical protein
LNLRLEATTSDSPAHSSPEEEEVEDILEALEHQSFTAPSIIVFSSTQTISKGQVDITSAELC